jgi:hypothetical protein
MASASCTAAPINLFRLCYNEGMDTVQAGVYKHYKGGLVLVLGVARHSERDERLVAYVPLGVKPGPRITVRPYDLFFGEVTIEERKVPRFLYIDETVDEAIAAWYDPLSGYRGKDRVD